MQNETKQAHANVEQGTQDGTMSVSLSLPAQNQKIKGEAHPHALSRAPSPPAPYSTCKLLIMLLLQALHISRPQ